MVEDSEIIKEMMVMVVEAVEVVVAVEVVEAAEEVDLMMDKEVADSEANKEVETNLVVVTINQDLQEEVASRTRQKESKREEDEYKIYIDLNEYFYLLFIN